MCQYKTFSIDSLPPRMRIQSIDIAPSPLLFLLHIFYSHAHGKSCQQGPASTPNASGFPLSCPQFLECLCLEALRWLQTFWHSPPWTQAGLWLLGLTESHRGEVILVLVRAFKQPQVSASSLLELLVLHVGGPWEDMGRERAQLPAVPIRAPVMILKLLGPFRAAWEPGEYQGMTPGHTPGSRIPWLGPAWVPDTQHGEI